MSSRRPSRRRALLLSAGLVLSNLALPASALDAAGTGADNAAPGDGIASPSLPAPDPINPGVSSYDTFAPEPPTVKDVSLPSSVTTSVDVAGETVAVAGLPIKLRVLTSAEVSALEAKIAASPPPPAENPGQTSPDGTVTTPTADQAAVDGSVMEDGRPSSTNDTTEGYVYSESEEWIAGVKPPAQDQAAVAPVSVKVSTFDPKAVEQLGAQGLAFSVVSEAQLNDPVWVEVDVDYSAFRYLHGGDWTERLQLSSWDCPSVLAAAGSTLCGDPRPVDGVLNNVGHSTLRAVVELSSGQVVGSFGRSLRLFTGNGSNLGLTSQEGTFAATTLQSDGSWQVAGNEGNFSYSVAIATPPALAGGPSPSVSLNYDSAGADALTGNHNSQASEVGVGWGLSAGQGYIERQYRACTEVGGGTGDTCWYVQNGFISLNGHSSELIPINGSTNSPTSHTLFRLKEDTDWLVERVPDTADSYGEWWKNEYWKVTTPDGFTYWFGVNASTQASVLKRPLRGITTGYPCELQPNDLCAENSPSGRDTSMPYRWMLDKVTDPYGNEMIYKYEKLINKAKTIGDANNEKSYDADALLTEIHYGKAPNAGITSYRDKVTFTYVRRCTDAISTNATYDNKDSACTPYPISNTYGSHYPDVPTDLYCPTATSCSNYPSFFHTKRLVGIATYSSTDGSNWTAVGQWRLTHSFPDPGDGTNEKLFLESVQRMDPATSPAGSQGTALLPAIRFARTAYNNRKDGSVGGGVSFQPVFRVTRITDELGKEINIAYESPTQTFVSWRTDTSNTYPRWITWGSSSGWAEFRRWVVDQVTIRDLVTGPSGQSGTAVTPLETWDYTYNGGAAKHYTPDFWFEDNNRSYNVWRGYGEILVTHGTGSTKTVNKTRYYRGMHADYDSSTGGTSTVKVTRTWVTSTSPSVEVFTTNNTPTTGLGADVFDFDYLAGMVYETYQMDGTGTSYLSAARNYATWYSESNGIEVKSTLYRIYRKWRQSLTYSRLRDGTAGSPTWRERRVDTSYDSLGRPIAGNDTGFLDKTNDQTCAQTGYISAAAAPTVGNFGWMNIVAYANTYPVLGTQPTHTTWAAGSCGAGVTTTQTQTFYHGNAYQSGGTVATAGSQSLTGFTPTPTASLIRINPTAGGSDYMTLWQVAQTGYDTAGRITSATDPNGNATSFSFNSTYGYPNAATYPISGLGTSTVLDPMTGQPTSTTDQNSNVTSYCYDNLGRLIRGFLPGQTVACTGSAAPAAQFSYDVGTYTNDPTTRDTKTPTIIVSTVLQSAGVTLQSAAYLDGTGRTRETQTWSPTTNKIIVSGVAVVDGRANPVTAVEAFAVTDTSGPGDRTSASGGSLGFAAWPNLPTGAGTLNTVETVYDTVNRATTATRKNGATSLVTTSSVYLGTRTEVTPQIGSKTASTVDAYGRTVTAEVYNGTTAPTGGSVTNGGTITQTTFSFNTTAGQSTSGYLTTTVADDGAYQTVTVTNLAGRVVTSTEPNAGTTAVSYDAVGNVTKLDDATTNTPIWTTYDALNRPLLRYGNATGSAPASDAEKLAQWVYDGPSGTPATGFKGLPVKEISWQNSAAYTTEITSYTNRNQIVASKVIVLGTFGTDVLAGEWRYQTTYDEAGHATQTKSPTAPVNTGAGDPTFDVTNTHYNTYGSADTLKGVDDTHQYVAATVFDDLARITQRTLSRTNNGTIEAAMVRAYTYNTQTRAVDNIKAGWDTTPTDTSDVTWFQNDQYTRDPIGNVTKVEDLGKETSGTSTDTKECFVYDNWNRLVRAHTATIATTCLTTTTASPVTNRGLLPYDTVWAYDDLARITVRTDKLTTTATSYSYGDTGHPYAVTGTNDGTTKSYEYNPIGSMNRRNGNGTAGTGDQLAYDNQGRLTTYTGTTTQTYRYATTNQRLLRTEGTTRVLYLPGLEATDTNGIRTITNYRAIASTVVATETATAVYWNCGNVQNSTTCQAQANTGTTPAVPARRHYQPYGNTRGTTTFATTDHGFLNQPEDTTGLTYLNNRYYDPALGAFTSVDPFVALTGFPYLYGDGSPITLPDPSGLGVGHQCLYILGATNANCEDTDTEEIHWNTNGAVTSVKRTQWFGCNNVFYACTSHVNDVTVDWEQRHNFYAPSKLKNALDRCPYSVDFCVQAAYYQQGGFDDNAAAEALQLGKDLYCGGHGCDLGAVYPDEFSQFLIDSLVTVGTGFLAKRAITMFATDTAAGLADDVGLQIAEGNAGHIFRNAAGHLADDTLANRAIIQSAADSGVLVRTSPQGVQTFRKILSDGTEAWAEVYQGQITNGGVNVLPRSP